MNGKLILLPNLLDTSQPGRSGFSSEMIETMKTLDGLIAESEKEGRRFLKRFLLKKKPHEIPIALLNVHTRESEIDFLLEPLFKGEIWGVVSDCGLPCIADPGSLLVSSCQRLKIPVVAFPGPSSIFMGLMLSGFFSQRFAFHGYLAKENEDRKQQLLTWQKCAQKEDETQIFIETPYRNLITFQFCLSTLSQKTSLCLASDLTASTQYVETFLIEEWKKMPLPKIQGRPTIFILK